MNFDVAPNCLKLIVNSRIKLIRHGNDNLWIWYDDLNTYWVMKKSMDAGVYFQSGQTRNTKKREKRENPLKNNINYINSFSNFFKTLVFVFIHFSVH